MMFDRIPGRVLLAAGDIEEDGACLQLALRLLLDCGQRGIEIGDQLAIQVTRVFDPTV